jgi:hypothetical protein
MPTSLKLSGHFADFHFRLAPRLENIVYPPNQRARQPGENPTSPAPFEANQSGSLGH